MTLVRTFMFYSKELDSVFSIEIYVAPVEEGFFNIDTNQAVINNQLYSQFRSCKTQAEQRKFFDVLKKISNTALPQ